MVIGKKLSFWFLAAVVLLGQNACHRDQPGGQVSLGKSGQGGKPNSIQLKHASGFSLEKEGPYTVVRVHRPWQGASEDFTYYLSGRDSAQVGAPKTIQVPVQRVVTLTTADIQHFETLDVLEALVGVGGGRYVCNRAVISGLRAGRIHEVGADGMVDAETILGLRPDVVFTYVVGNSSDGGLAKLKETGLNTVIDGSYMEETPLGRAEWLKFTAAFFGESARADSVYAHIDSGYSALAALARKAQHRPTVFVNSPFGGIWWVPGGRSYVARLLADAGADYLWAQDTARGSLNLDLESVLARASRADFWLNPGDWKSLRDGKSQDPRNGFFQAFQAGRVYNYNRIMSEAGGNDFFETGPCRPDWILADLISIFHPELLPGHVLHWYRKLEAT